MTILNHYINLVDAGIVAIFLLTAFFGYRRGIGIGVANFIRYSSGMFLCFYMSNNFYRYVYENYVKQKCLEIINQKIVVSNNIDETINNLNTYKDTLPDYVSQYMDFSNINITSTDISQSILTNIFEPFVLGAIKVLIFAAVFVVFFGITGIILLAIKRHIRRKDRQEGGMSKLRRTDKIFGLLFGMMKAVIIVFAISSIVRFFTDMDMNFVNNSVFLTEATKSELLKYFTDVSPFNAIMEGLI